MHSKNLVFSPFLECTNAENVIKNHEVYVFGVKNSQKPNRILIDVKEAPFWDSQITPQWMAITLTCCLRKIRKLPDVLVNLMLMLITLVSSLWRKMPNVSIVPFLKFCSLALCCLQKIIGSVHLVLVHQVSFSRFWKSEWPLDVASRHM